MIGGITGFMNLRDVLVPEKRSKVCYFTHTLKTKWIPQLLLFSRHVEHRSTACPDLRNRTASATYRTSASLSFEFKCDRAAPQYIRQKKTTFLLGFGKKTRDGRG